MADEYYIYPDVMALREGVADPQEAERLRRRVAANVGDLPSLRVMLGLDPEEFARFYPDMTRVTPSTTDTIDSFLEKFGKNDMPAADELTSMAMGQTESLLDDLEEMPIAEEMADKTSSAIDSFLASVASPAKTADAALAPEGIISETPEEKIREEICEKEEPDEEEMAHEAIRNHDYQAALEIILRISLNNPQKSIYFADQIRFLRKLILNQTNNTTANAEQSASPKSSKE